MTEATAPASVWVSASSQRTTPRARATAAARPWSTSAGAAPGARTTSTSRQPMPADQPVPSAFIAASLAAKRAA